MNMTEQQQNTAGSFLCKDVCVCILHTDRHGLEVQLINIKPCSYDSI